MGSGPKCAAGDRRGAREARNEPARLALLGTDRLLGQTAYRTLLSRMREKLPDVDGDDDLSAIDEFGDFSDEAAAERRRIQSRGRQD